jgi:undecaprenyl-diphosphatase
VQILEYVFIGVLQGLTEFLPVSSSAHMIIAQHWLRLNTPGILLEVAFHVATLLSVILVYRRELWQLLSGRNWRLLGLLAAATVVTVLMILPFKDWLSALPDAPNAVRICGAMLLVTAAWLAFADWRIAQAKPTRPLRWPGALLIGLAQGIAALPGISRSGATIGMGLQLGLEREEAARFSFLLSIPIVMGAGLLELLDAREQLQGSNFNIAGLSLGFIAATLSGIAAIYFLLWMLKRARFAYFAIYAALLGILALAIG